MPYTDDLVAGAIVINGNANIPNNFVAGTTVVNGNATIPNDIVTGTIIINGNANIPNYLVAGTTIVIGDATIPSTAVFNIDATSSGSDYDSSSGGYSSSETDNEDLIEELSEVEQEDKKKSQNEMKLT